MYEDDGDNECDKTFHHSNGLAYISTGKETGELRLIVALAA